MSHNGMASIKKKQIIKFLTFVFFSTLPLFAPILVPNFPFSTLLSNALFAQCGRPNLVPVQDNRQSYNFGYFNNYVYT